MNTDMRGLDKSTGITPEVNGLPCKNLCLSVKLSMKVLFPCANPLPRNLVALRFLSVSICVHLWFPSFGWGVSRAVSIRGWLIFGLYKDFISNERFPRKTSATPRAAGYPGSTAASPPASC